MVELKTPAAVSLIPYPEPAVNPGKAFSALAFKPKGRAAPPATMFVRLLRSYFLKSGYSRSIASMVGTTAVLVTFSLSTNSQKLSGENRLGKTILQQVKT